MSTKNWTAPVFLDLETLESPEKDEWSHVTNTQYKVAKPKEVPAEFQKPVVLDDHDVTVEPVSHLRVQSQHSTRPHAAYSASDEVEIPASEPSQTPGWVWPAVGATILVAMGLEIIFLLIDTFTEHFALGVAYLAFFSAIIAAVVFAVRHYYDDIKRLSDITALRQRGDDIFQANEHGHSHRYIGELIHLYQNRADMVPKLEKFVAKNNDSHSDRDSMVLFSEAVMTPLDKKAYAITVQRSKETALAVVLSPFAFLDVLLTLWRNVRLIRDIASLYGGRPGFLSSMGLIKKVLQSLAYAEVGELLADSATETVGGSLVAALSTHIAHGVGSGIMTARVGIHAMQVCRPMPYVNDDQPSLKGVRRSIVTSVKDVMGTKDEKPVGQNA